MVLFTAQDDDTVPLIYTEALSSQHCPVKRKSKSPRVDTLGHTSPKIRILISFFDHSSERIRDTEPPILSLYCRFHTRRRTPCSYQNDQE